jgi:hypothetical protein
VLEIIRSAEDSSPCQEFLNQCGYFGSKHKLI